MKKKLIKIIALLVLSLVGIFCCSNVNAQLYNATNTTIYKVSYDSSERLVLSFAQTGNYCYEDEMMMETYCYEYGGFGYSPYTGNWGAGGIKIGDYYFSNPVYIAGECSYKEHAFNDDYNDYGFVYSAGSPCVIGFERIKTTGTGGTTLYDTGGTAMTKTQIDTYFGINNYLETKNFTEISNQYWDGTSDGNAWQFRTSSYTSTLFGFDYTPPITPINGVCGSANGSTFDWDDFDNQDFCSAGDFYLAGDNGERIIYHCAGLNGGTNQYNCFADYYYDLDPTIDDVIDFDFDDFEYDFEEGDVSKNWLIDIFRFLFLPREQTLQKFFTAFDNFKQKIPFGYIYLIQDKFKQVSLESTDEFALNLELLGEDYEVFSVTSLKEQIGQNTFNIFYDIMKALIWIVFVLYLISKVQKLFSNN